MTHELGNWHPTQGILITSSLVCVKGVIACDDMTKKCKNENDCRDFNTNAVTRNQSPTYYRVKQRATVVGYLQIPNTRRHSVKLATIKCRANKRVLED